MKFSKKRLQVLVLAIFILSAKINGSKWKLKLSAMIRGLSGNGVGQAKWLSAKVNDPNFG